MILKDLAALARRERLVEDPDFEPREVRWVVTLGSGGKFLGVADRRDSSGARRGRSKVERVPRQPYRSGTSPPPYFLVDKAEFSLGHDPDDKPSKRGRLRDHPGKFAEYVERAAALEPDEPGLSTVLAFLRNEGELGRAVAEVRGRAASNDLIAFRYEADDDPESGLLVHERARVRAAWERMRGAPADEEGPLMECLVCGGPGGSAATHPPIKRVPGAAASVMLISFNKPAFESLGLEGNANAPVCRPCGEAYAAALNRLLHPAYPGPVGVLGKRSFRLSDDTAVVYWAARESPLEDDFTAIDYDPADPERATAFFKSVHEGKAIALDPTQFFALIVSGAEGRMTLRGYHETTVGQVAASLRRYFEDITLVRRFPNSPEWPPLSWLVRSLAAQGKFENVDPDLAGRIFLAVISGAPFPAAVLRAAVGRIRSEREDPDRGRVKHSRERLALVRATLNRWLRAGDRRATALIDKEIPPVLDPSCRNNAYCLGQLFAVLEKLQGEAINSPNATIADRYYGAASATPAAVFGTLLRKAQHHLSKMSGPFYAQKIQEILGLLDPENAFPGTLGLAEQGLYALGYYHQRADLWKQKEKSREGQKPVAAAE
jgi:CRISPR-associated protein Csd1